MGNEAGDESFLESLGDEERDRLATLVADNFATQVLIDGFYHADPHSGNVLIHPDATVVSTSDATDVERSEAEKLAQNGITWIDFGMMGSLSSKERQTLIDLVTAVMKRDAYGLKRIVLQVATPRGEIDHGAMLEMCESMCDQSTGVDFGEFSLGDLLRMVLENLQEGDYEIDPFLTNLSRGIIAAEGTVRTISPRVNILNCFVGKVDFGPDFKNLDLEETVSEVLMKVLNGAEGNVELPKKAIESEKGMPTIRHLRCAKRRECLAPV